MGSPNGGIIGVINPSSFGKCTQTVTTSSGNLTTQPGTRIAQTLIVAGGGGSGGDGAGGGGAGGLRNLQINVCGATTYPITVGAGGAYNPSGGQRGGSGTNSSVFGNSSTGGGGSGGTPQCVGSGLPGGSGGGGGRQVPATPNAGGSGNAGGYDPVEGFKGGDVNAPNPGQIGSAGGGGSGGAGVNKCGTGPSPYPATEFNGTNGGNGLDVSPTFGPGLPNSGVYAGGGGGSGYQPGGTGGTGGTGGGGNASDGSSSAQSGTTNTGGGGGGSGANS